VGLEGIPEEWRQNREALPNWPFEGNLKAEN
jgi:hypothetical protein